MDTKSSGVASSFSKYTSYVRESPFGSTHVQLIIVLISTSTELFSGSGFVGEEGGSLKIVIVLMVIFVKLSLSVTVNF